MKSCLMSMHKSLLFFFGCCSGSRSAIVTNTTVEIVVPENVIGSVYGENGSNLARLRQVVYTLISQYYFAGHVEYIFCYVQYMSHLGTGCSWKLMILTKFQILLIEALGLLACLVRLHGNSTLASFTL